jgi:circadian clock protein KaiB
MRLDERTMKTIHAHRPTKGFERAAASRPADEYILKLYVAGSSNRSRQAILRARELCAGELKGHCRLEVIDIYQEPIRARDGQIVATPTLVKELPRPVRRLIGTLSKSSRLFVGLGLDTPGRSGP